MNGHGLLLGLLLIFICGCRNPDKEESGASGYFPVLSYLQSQVRHVDTSLYSIIKISKRAGIADTAYLRREDFRAAAQDFLSVPDIASKKLQKRYAETRLYDEDLKKVVLTYEPKDKEDAEGITRQDVLIEPGDAAGDRVQTIYIETLLNGGDSTVQQRLTWNVDKSFRVIRMVTKKNNPETVHTTEVTWSEHR